MTSNHGPTDKEMKYINLKPPYEENERVSDSVMLAAIFILVVISFITAFHFILEPSILGIAHAEEPIRQNDFYCRQIAKTHEAVIGANEDEVTKLCANYK